MRKSEEINAISPEKYGTRKAKPEDIKELNIPLFYNIIRMQRFPETSTFTDFIMNYDLVVHIIASPSL